MMIVNLCSELRKVPLLRYVHRKIDCSQRVYLVEICVKRKWIFAM